MDGEERHDASAQVGMNRTSVGIVGEEQREHGLESQSNEPSDSSEEMRTFENGFFLHEQRHHASEGSQCEKQRHAGSEFGMGVFGHLDDVGIFGKADLPSQIESTIACRKGNAIFVFKDRVGLWR